MSKKIKWKKGQNWMDGSPEYFIKDRRPPNSVEDITVLIYREREPIFRGAREKEYVYYGDIFENSTETGDRLGPFKTVTKAKKEMEGAFLKYIEIFNKAV